VKRHARELIAGPDGKLDEQALISLAAAVVLMCLVAFIAWVKHEFDAVAFGAAIAALGAHRGASAYANAKEASEPAPAVPPRPPA
jgi:hypothetical protein